MTYAPTVAEGWATIRTDRPLHDIAADQAASRVLSPATRAYFRDLTKDVTVNAYSPLDRERAYFEVAASMSTRLGQSYARRRALGDVHRLHEADIAGLPIAPRGYTIGAPVGVTVNPDGTLELTVYLGEAAEGVADSFDDADDITPGEALVAAANRQTDSATVAAAVAAGRFTVTASKGA